MNKLRKNKDENKTVKKIAVVKAVYLKAFEVLF